jgi:hypothetical protein
MDLIDQMHRWSLPQLHILLTSQTSEIRITDCIRRITLPRDQIDLEKSGIDEDIRRHVRQSLQTPQLRRRFAASGIWKTIEDTLVAKAEGS